MSDQQPVGAVIDGLGCTAAIEPDELVAGAVVILKVVDDQGAVALRSCWSDGMSWIERVGMLRVAEQVELPDQGSGWEPG